MKTAIDTVASSYPSQTNTTSFILWSYSIIRASVQISISSGTMNGTFALQGSNDKATGQYPNSFVPTNWNTVGGSTSIICSTTAAGASSFLLGPIEPCYEWLRLNYTAGNSGAALGLYSVNVKNFSQ